MVVFILFYVCWILLLFLGPCGMLLRGKGKSTLLFSKVSCDCSDSKLICMQKVKDTQVLEGDGWIVLSLCTTSRLKNIEVVQVIFNRTVLPRMEVWIAEVHLTGVWEFVLWSNIIVLYWMPKLSFGEVPNCTLDTLASGRWIPALVTLSHMLGRLFVKQGCKA